MASFVHKAMADAGLAVIAVDHLQCDAEFLSRLRRLVSECSAVVILLTRSTLHTQDVPFEIGMALAWKKPIYLLYDGIDVKEIPPFLHEYRVRPLSRLHTFVAEISTGVYSTAG
jgi:hypothetical protein